MARWKKNKKLETKDAEKYKALPIKLSYKKMDENSGYAPYFREVLRGEVADVLKDLKNSEGDDYSVYRDDRESVFVSC